MKITESLAIAAAKLALSNALNRNPFYQHFKIGKTTQALGERFCQNYANSYKDIALLYDGGTNGKMIDTLEEEMIRYCLSTYGEDVCDNDQIGGGPSCEDHVSEYDTAKLYVVWK